MSKLQNYSTIFRKTVNHHLSSSLTPLHYFTPLDFIFWTIAVQILQQANSTGLDFELSEIKEQNTLLSACLFGSIIWNSKKLIRKPSQKCHTALTKGRYRARKELKVWVYFLDYFNRVSKLKNSRNKWLFYYMLTAV